MDIIATNSRPLLSIFNASGGSGKRTYIFQIDKVPTFDSDTLIEYGDIPEANKYITEKQIEENDALADKTRHYWRARAVDSTGKKGPWATTRFYLDTASDDSFMNLRRISVQEVEVSSGQNPKNIIDLDDPGQSTFWLSSPPGDPVQWVKFDLAKTTTVARIWMLSDRGGRDGWLKNFLWQMSHNGEAWTDVPGAAVANNDTFRNIIDIKLVSARYFRLLIKSWYGYAPQINAITFYSPGMPTVPETPEGDYVLIIGNQMDGFTFTELARFVEGLDLNLKALTVPHYEVSVDMVKKLRRKPVAIICSGNNASYQNLPMFEYNGEFEIIRETEIPLLGICCGHHLTCMAYGFTFAKSMGWSDITSLELEEDMKMTPISILKKYEDLPIFKGIPNPFIALEIHGWEVSPTSLPEDYVITSESSYVQTLKSKSRMIYGEQFHAEIKVDYNQGTPYLVNFLKMAIEKARGEKKN
jgi:GMP synthase-like glutamine amidotransferase